MCVDVTCHVSLLPAKKKIYIENISIIFIFNLNIENM